MTSPAQLRVLSDEPRAPLRSGIYEILRDAPPISETRRTPSSPPPRPRRGPGRYDRRISTDERRMLQHEHLLDAAARVFAREGFAQATVAQILEESGLSRGTFYRHFDDLDCVLLAVRQRAAKLVLQAVERKVVAETDPLAKLAAGITAFLAFIGQHGDLLRVLRRETKRTDEHERVRLDVETRFMALMKVGLDEAVASGQIAHAPNDTAVYAIVMGILGVGSRYLEANRDAEAIEAAPTLVELCLRTLT